MLAKEYEVEMDLGAGIVGWAPSMALLQLQASSSCPFYYPLANTKPSFQCRMPSVKAVHRLEASSENEEEIHTVQMQIYKQVYLWTI